MRGASRHRRSPRRAGAATATLVLTCALAVLACTGIGLGSGPAPTVPTDVTATATATLATPTVPTPKPTSTPKPKPTPTPVPFRITGVSVSVSPSHYTGGCVNVIVTFTVTFKMLAQGPGGTISFYTSNPDGPPSGTMTVKAKAGQTTVTATQQVDYDQASIFADESPWVQVHATKPNSVTSSKSNYVFTCLG